MFQLIMLTPMPSQRPASLCSTPFLKPPCAFCKASSTNPLIVPPKLKSPVNSNPPFVSSPSSDPKPSLKRSPCQQPIFDSILETHIKDHNLNYLMNKVCRGWNYTSNHLSDEDGRIVVIWKDSVSVNILCQSRQTLTCEVKIPSSSLFVYTAIYASNESTERADLWVELLNLHHTYALSTVPWMLGGDLNQIIHYDEHSIASVNSFTARMVELKDCLLQMELFDMRFQGPLFTWSNRQPDDPIAKKLDCLLINNHVLNLFPNCTSFFLPTFFSDHSPCITDLSFTIPSSGTRPFKFFNYLTLHP
ncbi:unnamed protein product, partial [Brassica rapa subsp. narinosa]